MIIKLLITLPIMASGLAAAILTNATGQENIWQKFAAIKRGELTLEQSSIALSEHAEQTGSAGQSHSADHAAFANAASARLEHAVIYTRVPRTLGSHAIQFRDGSPFTLESPDAWDKLPDSSNVFEGFNAPGQLVMHHADGSEQLLFDCFQSSAPCVPLDPMVSFDGRKVLFSVYYGKRLQNLEVNGSTLPNRQLREPIEARLHIADLESGQVTALAHTAGVFDVSPAWLPDGRIMFASTRAGTEEPLLENISPNNRRSGEPQLYISNADGTGAVNISPHEVATAMHPYVLKSGRIAYSSQWLSHNLAYIHAGGINWPGTIPNFWVINDMDIRGGDMTTILGGHRNSFQTPTGRTKTMKALHFLGQRQNSDICAANYYRANNLGLGDILCWEPEPVGVEGALPDFLPRKLYSVANWSKSNDEPAFQDDNGIYMGKIGYPEGLPDNQLLLTYGRGFCTQVGFAVRRFEELAATQPGRLACDTGLYVTTRIPSVTPSDLALVVDRPEWHEFGARVVVPRQVDTPPLMNTVDGSCQLASSDAGTAETSPSRPYRFNSNYTTSANNGGQIDGLSHGELAGIRFWEVVPNPNSRRTFRNSIGNQLRLIGDVPLLEDKSFKVQLPCDTPFIMAGIDDRGRVIMRDQIPQSLRRGEKRVCTGCHLHSREGRPYEQSMASRMPPLELLTTQPVPTYEKDIKPIFEARCQSCHNPLIDYDSLVWDFFQETLAEEERIQVSNSQNSRLRYGLQRPYTSKFVNTMFARESLLYWKAANQRTDGRSDRTYDDDIDFGADHPTSITEEELATIAAWLDSGATSVPGN